MGECMDCPVEYFDQDFDCKPLGVSRLTTDERINQSGSCNLCRAPITPPGDFGFSDFTVQADEENEREPEWVPLCWGCVRQWMYDESNVVDPKTGRRATDGLEAV